jgi:Tfp pilus assembly protein PilO
MKKLSKRDRRILIIGGSFAIIIVLVFYIVLPFYESMSEIDQELEQKQKVLSRAVTAIQNQNVYNQQLIDLENSFAHLESQLLEGNNTNVAQSELENTVRRLADQHGVEISRSTPLQAKTIGSLAKVTVQINTNGALGELSTFLHALSVHPKFFEIESFTINGFRVRDRIRLQPPINGFRVRDRIRLQPRMNISAYVQVTEADNPDRS